MALEGTAPAEAAPAETPAPEWYDSLPADILNDDIKAFKGPDELAKAFIDTKGKIPVVPDKYEFQFPKEFAKEHVDLIQMRAKEIGLTQDQFKQLAQREVEALAQASEESLAEHRKVVDALRKEWGAQTDERLKKALSVADALFGEGWHDQLKMEDHPAVLKGLYILSTKLGEDTLRHGGGTLSGPKIGPDGYAILSYPSMDK
jgi:hypothetical protein